MTDSFPCPECRTELRIFVTPDRPDGGSVRCEACMSIWCACKSHGVYECPPPCPTCPGSKRAAAASLPPLSAA
jgi:predicted Zn finger-like uncharacterized protein